MDFALSPKHQMFQKVFREFAQKEVAPLAAEIDETCEFPLQSVKKMAKLGIMGLIIPKEYGGSGADYTTLAIAMEEIGQACATTSDIVAAHLSLCTSLIHLFGTEEQKRKYVVPLAKGEFLGAFALSEPNAGSDASNQETVAVLDEGQYVINGTKMFTTNGGYADVYVVFAMTDKSKGLRGISMFIVEKNTPGFTTGKKFKKMGIRGSSITELVFDECRIPKQNLLGREGEGFKLAMQALESGRIVIAAQALGIAQAAMNESVKYLKERVQFGKPIAKQQGIQFIIADMATEIDAARLLVYRAAWLKDNKMPYGKEASMAKLYASETAMRATTKAVQLHGGYGYIKEYKVERLMRDAKITEIYEGTSEIQRMIIGGSVLK